jgi:hypothetical protein
MKVWTYVIRSDVGGAPNPGPPAVTLVLCKPGIRRTAERGELVLAFNGARVEDQHGFASFRHDRNTVRWAGLIGEVMPMADYWRDPRFAGKKPGAAPMPDNIYRPFEDGFVQEENETHGPADRARDLSGRNALIFSRTWHFGRAAPSLPEGFGLWMGDESGKGRRGERRSDLDEARADMVLDWLGRQAGGRVAVPPAVAGRRGKGCGAPARTRRC